MSPESFKAASKAAELWIVIVSQIESLEERGRVDAAYRWLHPTPGGLKLNLQASYNEHAGTLSDAFGDLAVLSDGPVKWEQGRGWGALVAKPARIYPHIWSSAHEAAHGIAQLALSLLVDPLEGITDPEQQRSDEKQLLSSRWKALVIPVDEIATLRERIHRERAKLLENNLVTVEDGAPSPLRLTVDLVKLQATLDGKPFDVASENALRWIKVLAEHPGDWISGTELEEYDALSGGTPTNKLKSFLPKPILALIDSKPGKGSRILL